MNQKVDTLSDKATIQTLVNQMKPMYQQGFKDGVVEALREVAENLAKNATDDACSDQLRPGYVSAAKYLEQVAKGQSYNLLSPDVSDT